MGSAIETRYLTITTDANGDGNTKLRLPGAALIANLRGYFNVQRVEFFRLFWTVQRPGGVETPADSGGGGGGGGDFQLRSPPQLANGIYVPPNATITIYVQAGSDNANSTCNVQFDWMLI